MKEDIQNSQKHTKWHFVSHQRNASQNTVQYYHMFTGIAQMKGKLYQEFAKLCNYNAC